MPLLLCLSLLLSPQWNDLDPCERTSKSDDLTEKLPIRSVAGRVADRPNKHSSSLEPKELYF